MKSNYKNIIGRLLIGVFVISLFTEIAVFIAFDSTSWENTSTKNSGSPLKDLLTKFEEFSEKENQLETHWKNGLSVLHGLEGIVSALPNNFRYLSCHNKVKSVDNGSFYKKCPLFICYHNIKIPSVTT